MSTIPSHPLPRIGIEPISPDYKTSILPNELTRQNTPERNRTFTFRLSDERYTI